MNYRVQVYDSFSGISPLDRAVVEQFIHRFGEVADSGEITEALDYAVKNKPSFGGFIIAAWQGMEVQACVVVNKTGMGSFNACFVLAYAAVHPAVDHPEAVLQELIGRARQHAKGDIAFHLPPGNPGISLFKRLGFEERYVELRLGAHPASKRHPLSP